MKNLTLPEHVIEKHLPFIKRVAISQTRITDDDRLRYLSNAMEGFFETYSAYPETHQTFSKLATMRMIQRIIDQKRIDYGDSRRPKIHYIREGDMTFTIGDKAKTMDLFPASQTNDSDLARDVIIDILDSNKHLLNYEERYVLQRKYLDIDRPRQYEIAKELSISSSKVTKLLKEAEKKLKKRVQE